MAEPLYVAIDARFTPEGGGSNIPVLMQVVDGLSALEGDERYIIVTHAENLPWLEPHVGPNQRLHVVPRPVEAPTARGRAALRQALGPLRSPLRAVRRVLTRRTLRASFVLPTSDGILESCGAQVAYFVHPLHFQRTALPSVVTIHDVEHRHFPEMFSPGHLAWRDFCCGEACTHSDAVVCPAECVRTDILEQYHPDPAHLHIARLAPFTLSYRAPSAAVVERVRQTYQLPQRFALFPAFTYRHKNHVALLEALALLRDSLEVRIQLICCGLQTEHWPLVQARLQELHLQDQVRFLGFLAEEELRALYGLAEELVFPTLFEGAGIPVIEAMQAGLPVACSDIPSLREYTQGGALFFDPRSPTSIAEGIRVIWSDASLRARLAAEGPRLTAQLTPVHTAEAYRAVFRAVSPLSR